MDVSKNRGLKGSSNDIEAGVESLEISTQENTKSSQGQGLLEEVASLTGLPQDWMQNELHRIVTASGHQPSELTLDELRASMLAYLEQMMDQIPAEEDEVHELIPGEVEGSLPN